MVRITVVLDSVMVEGIRLGVSDRHRERGGRDDRTRCVYGKE